ncbi:MAG: DNA-directed RNA polymerase subunit omega [Candidatus Caldatribacteriota bacterium]|nr:DNA-directed RNA polymerase subunit omega [Candidatus Caldatribacteriota bacterium]
MEENRFLLAIMIAKRMKELNDGAKPLVKSKQKKSIRIAFEEIEEGKVFVKKQSKSKNIETEDIFDESITEE